MMTREVSAWFSMQRRNSSEEAAPRWLVLLAGSLGCMVLLAGAAFGVDEVAGHWQGQIEIPGMPLIVRVDLEPNPDGWSGSIDIPTQNATGLPLVDIRVLADAVDAPEGERPTTSLRFTIQGVPGDPTFTGTASDGEIVGTFRQGPAEFPFRLRRDAVAEPNRPQHPRPPFPYRVEEVEYENGEIRLAATLTLPQGPGPHPALVLITGSGAQDRDESLMGHRPFLVLADHLTRAGYAVLRADDRGVGGSTGSVGDATSEDFAGDALAGVALLAADDRVDAQRIGLLGHSEGGIVGPIAAVRSESVAFLVLLAGTGVPGSEVLVLQLQRIAAANGVPLAAREEQVRLQQRAIEVIRSTAPDEERRSELREIVKLQIGLQQPAQGDALEAAVEQASAAVLNEWFRFFVDHDPRPVLREVRVPVLVLNGSLDLQVVAEQNVPEIVRALLAGSNPNPDVTARVLPGLNHLFQTSTTGSPQEYAMIEETIAPVVLESITSWLLERYPPAGASGPRRDP